MSCCKLNSSNPCIGTSGGGAIAATLTSYGTDARISLICSTSFLFPHELVLQRRHVTHTAIYCEDKHKVKTQPGIWRRQIHRLVDDNFSNVHFYLTYAVSVISSLSFYKSTSVSLSMLQGPSRLALVCSLCKIVQVRYDKHLRGVHKVKDHDAVKEQRHHAYEALIENVK